MDNLLIVTGSRYAPESESCDHIVDIIRKESIKEIWEGGARGADAAARKVAAFSNLKLRTFEAQWDVLGKAAGHSRNKVMIRTAKVEQLVRPVIVLAIFAIGAENRGTTHCLQEAMACNFPINIRWVTKK